MRPPILDVEAEGWMSTEKFAERYKCSVKMARERLKKLTKTGKLERLEHVHKGRVHAFYRPKLAQ